MGLGTNRDYKTRDRDTTTRIKRHIERTKELVAEGMDKEEASKKAFEEITGLSADTFK